MSRFARQAKRQERCTPRSAIRRRRLLWLAQSLHEAFRRARKFQLGPDGEPVERLRDGTLRAIRPSAASASAARATDLLYEDAIRTLLNDPTTGPMTAEQIAMATAIPLGRAERILRERGLIAEID